ncbi:MAG TPA: tRNA (adenosine(37)-N6)-threonylcarbamoyltransferase complex ATPase subunit type 1 TsaE [Acidimicrobiales bacterium]|nr:tRNA (adenosine(37)-N6)-threonylcarbamoyltransferase complex ATPase subunit type 1 TsaE [Acidimicrobiales bacterium]
MIRALTKSADDTRALAAELAPLLRAGDLLVLAGDLGTGKTAFVQGLARGLGVSEPVTSPAFVLVRTYRGRLPLVHVDVYRLDHLQEVVDLGLPELVDEEGVAAIEWGDVVLPTLPADFLEVRLDQGDNDDDRTIAFEAVGPSWAPRLAALGRAVGRWAVEV